MDTERVIDLRSDTLTKPTAEMRQAMAEAEVGDDVYGEDPTTLKLQELAAKMLGKEAALFVPSGTMGNLTSIMAHCWGRGLEILVGDQTHIYLYEQGGSSQLAGVHACALKIRPDGTFDISELRNKIKQTSDSHMCRTALICLENTNNRCGGAVLPTEYVDAVCKVAKHYGIPVHMDGARIFNAAVHLGQPVDYLVRDCDSVSLCLSKGLGAPLGTIVAGNADFISRIHRCRKLLGGGMRQVGIVAAAGIIALQNIEERLSRDHHHARIIAEAILNTNSSVVTADLKQIQSNMVLLIFKSRVFTPEMFTKRLAEVTDDEKKELGCSIIVKTMIWSSSQVRCVLHSDISDADVKLVIQKIEYVLKNVDTTLRSSNSGLDQAESLKICEKCSFENSGNSETCTLCGLSI